MLGGSALSLSEATRQLDQAVGDHPTLAGELSGELFAFLDALDHDGALVRALANPNTAISSRIQLVATLMAGHLDKAIAYIQQVVSLRWSHDADLPNAVEQLAFDAALAQYHSDGCLRMVESELFEVDITLVNHRELRTALGDMVATSEQRGELAQAVFGNAISPQAMVLLLRMVTHPRGRGIRYSLKVLGDLVAERRKRTVAVVIAAQELSDAQVDRLTEILEAGYGHKMQVNIAIDPRMVGGLRVRVGDEVVDGTMLARFGQLKRAIAA